MDEPLICHHKLIQNNCNGNTAKPWWLTCTSAHNGVTHLLANISVPLQHTLHAKSCSTVECADLKSFFRDVGMVVEQLLNMVVAPVSGQLSQQHVVLVVLAHS